METLIGGKRVFVSPLLGPHSVPQRDYKPRGEWASDAHRQRVQKKWTKRFGTKIVDDILFTADSIFMSRQNYEKLQRELSP